MCCEQRSALKRNRFQTVGLTGASMLLAILVGSCTVGKVFSTSYELKGNFPPEELVVQGTEVIHEVLPDQKRVHTELLKKFPDLRIEDLLTYRAQMGMYTQSHENQTQQVPVLRLSIKIKARENQIDPTLLEKHLHNQLTLGLAKRKISVVEFNSMMNMMP